MFVEGVKNAGFNRFRITFVDTMILASSWFLGSTEMSNNFNNMMK